VQFIVHGYFGNFAQNYSTSLDVIEVEIPIGLVNNLMKTLAKLKCSYSSLEAIEAETLKNQCVLSTTDFYLLKRALIKLINSSTVISSETSLIVYEKLLALVDTAYRNNRDIYYF
jgi:hypothetical protein